jgi:hypothetical protein
MSATGQRQASGIPSATSIYPSIPLHSADIAKCPRTATSGSHYLMTAQRAASALRDFRKLSRRRPAAPPPGFVFEVEREHFDEEDDSDEDVAPGR